MCLSRIAWQGVLSIPTIYTALSSSSGKKSRRIIVLASFGEVQCLLLPAVGEEIITRDESNLSGNHNSPFRLVSMFADVPQPPRHLSSSSIRWGVSVTLHAIYKYLRCLSSDIRHNTFNCSPKGSLGKLSKAKENKNLRNAIHRWNFWQVLREGRTL